MNKLVVANIQHFAMLSDNIAAVVASTYNVESAADYAAKIHDKFDGKLEIIPHTVRNATVRETAKAVSFHVRPVTESRPYEDANQMRTVIEANVFADEDDATWQVVEASGVKRLVKRTDTDINALLQAASNQNIHRIAASNFAIDASPINEGEYAVFTNPETASIDSGVVFYGKDGGLQVLALSSGNLVDVVRDAVVAHSAFGFEAEEGDSAAEVAALEKQDTKDVLQYYRTLYSSQPAFFAELQAMINKKTALA